MPSPGNRNSLSSNPIAKFLVRLPSSWLKYLPTTFQCRQPCDNLGYNVLQTFFERFFELLNLRKEGGSDASSTWLQHILAAHLHKQNYPALTLLPFVARQFQRNYIHVKLARRPPTQKYHDGLPLSFLWPSGSASLMTCQVCPTNLRLWTRTKACKSRCVPSI